MIDPRSIDQDALEERPIIIWEGEFGGPRFRVVMAASLDAGDVPRLVAEELEQDAMGGQKWTAVGGRGADEIFRLALMSIAATGHPLVSAPVAPVSIWLEVVLMAKNDPLERLAAALGTRLPVLVEFDDRPEPGTIHGCRIMRGNLEVIRWVAPEPLPYDSSCKLWTNEDTGEVEVEPGPPMSELDLERARWNGGAS